eukprot:1161179-Pelagomonas_calceolata.AAC.6
MLDRVMYPTLLGSVKCVMEDMNALWGEHPSKFAICAVDAIKPLINLGLTRQNAKSLASKGLLGLGLLGARQWRAGEGESGRPVLDVKSRRGLNFAAAFVKNRRHLIGKMQNSRPLSCKIKLCWAMIITWAQSSNLEGDSSVTPFGLPLDKQLKLEQIH